MQNKKHRNLYRKRNKNPKKVRVTNRQVARMLKIATKTQAKMVRIFSRLWHRAIYSRQSILS